MPNVVSIILARGGSKGIPKKNIIDFCGKPLILWTIEQFQQARLVDSVWVSSDNREILEISKSHNAQIIERPAEISGDEATSESAWLHAIDFIENQGLTIDVVIAPQVTSPLREVKDIDIAIEEFRKQNLDSMFSCSVAEDLYFWKKTAENGLQSVNYDYKNRVRRQDYPEQHIENGSFYLFKPNVLKSNNNRFGGKIGMSKMEFWKMFEIDSLDDLKMCRALMKAFLIEK